MGYETLKPYFGDLHNHCGISYGHGSLTDALNNAAQRLDFCSVTGHAAWPDMPPETPRIKPILDFHHVGFAKLREGWPRVLETLRRRTKEGAFVLFPGYEIHSSAFGDYTILYKQIAGDIIYAASPPALEAALREFRGTGNDGLAFPHHLAYRRGHRGINWDAFSETLSPLVEIISMHGCSEGNENIRPFLHSMGPSDWHSTMQYGLARGYVFGVLGNTDHHSAHPGSYGHGLTGLWASSLTRNEIWRALRDRRTYALTGDKIVLQYSINGAPMGSVIPRAGRRAIDIEVEGRAPIDYVDVVKNNRLLRRFSETDLEPQPMASPSETLLYLELGWGSKGRSYTWDATFGISEGEILDVEPRFRGLEVLSPLDKEDGRFKFFQSRWDQIDERTVHFETVTSGNPTTTTPGTQGVCLRVVMPLQANVVMTLNDWSIHVPLRRLVEGAYADYTGSIDSPAFRLHRAPSTWEYRWSISFEDEHADGEPAFYHVRVRQKNDQWAWSSPIFCH